MPVKTTDINPFPDGFPYSKEHSFSVKTLKYYFYFYLEYFSSKRMVLDHDKIILK
jgi:hypothetical protein